MNGLTVGDGFKFGCGFFLAAFLTWLVMAIIGGIAAAVLTFMGINLPAYWGLTSQLPQLLNLVV